MNHEKFNTRIDKTGDCWLYIGARNRCGYGWITAFGTQMHAHRYHWIIVNGEIPAGLQVLHQCDNPACVRLSHLYLGTATDNMQDRANRRRCSTQKLTLEAVKELRQLRSDGWKLRELAARFGICIATASAVARGDHYGRE